MKTFDVNQSVKDLEKSIRFYTTLFGSEPTVQKPDYAKWMLEDPRVNFAIGLNPYHQGIEQLGIQAENEQELKEVYARLEKAEGEIREEGHTTCCYAKSEKSWISDPDGVDWETFYTYGEATVYGETIPDTKRDNDGIKVSAQTKCCSSI